MATVRTEQIKIFLLRLCSTKECTERNPPRTASLQPLPSYGYYLKSFLKLLTFFLHNRARL